MGKGPSKENWPHTKGKTFLEVCDIYYQYLQNKTFYRDIKEVLTVFKSNGFITDYRIVYAKVKKRIPEKLLRNGYPRGQIKLFIRKKIT